MEKQWIKNIKQNKGITLIALVITIVVMLLLVAVTISMAINGGLFDYAGKATGETQNSIDNEQGLADLAANMTIDELIDKFTTTEPEGGEQKLSEVVSVGDLVAYDHGSAVEEFSAYGGFGYMGASASSLWYLDAANYTGGWRVVHLGDNGEIYLMSATSVGDVSIIMESYNSNNGAAFFNKIASVYVNPEFASEGFVYNYDLGWSNAVETFGTYWNEAKFWIDETGQEVVSLMTYEVVYQWSKSFFSYAFNGLGNYVTSGFYPIIKLNDGLETTGKNEDGEWVIKTDRVKLSEVATVGDLVAYDQGNAVEEISGYGTVALFDNSSLMYVDATNYTGGWRVVHLGEDGSVYLMSTSSVGTLQLRGMAAYNHINSDGDLFNKICSVYVNTMYAEQGFAYTSDLMLNWTGTLDTFRTYWSGIEFWFDVASYYGTSVSGFIYGVRYWDGTSDSDEQLSTNTVGGDASYSHGVCPIIKLKDGLMTTGKNAEGEWVIIPLTTN